MQIRRSARQSRRTHDPRHPHCLVSDRGAGGSPRPRHPNLFKRWLSEWAVQRGHLKPIYSPPAALPETVKQKRIGYPLSDGQILHLLDNLPAGDVHDRWRFAIQLCAVYGLRPEKLRHLLIKDVVSGAKLWTTYQK